MKQTTMAVGLAAVVSGCTYDDVTRVGGCEVGNLSLEILHHQKGPFEKEYLELEISNTETGEYLGVIGPFDRWSIDKWSDGTSVSCNYGKSLVINEDFVGITSKKE